MTLLVDDKQAREKTAADDLRWLIAYSNDCKLSNQRLEEIASLIESLSAQVAESDRLAEYANKVCDRWQLRAIAAEAQVAELKKDAERVLYKQCSKHEGMAYTFMVTTMPYTRIICPQCDAAKESGE